MSEIAPWGDTELGPVYRIVLRNGPLSVGLLNLGVITQSLSLDGENLVLGHQELAPYLNDTNYLGAIVGRVANRVSKAQFELAGRVHSLVPNEGPNQLHGGPNGFSKRLWEFDQLSQNSVRFQLTSPAGDMGYPAQVNAQVVVTLKEDRLIYDMTATCDGPTPINLAQHNYYALGNMSLSVNASQYCANGADNIPTGEILSCDGGFDFSKMKPVADLVDHNFILNKSGEHAAQLSGDKAHITLVTDQPGIQVYTGHGLSDPFEPCQGLCLEPQYFPNYVNTPNFVGQIHDVDHPYSQHTTLLIRQP